MSQDRSCSERDVVRWSEAVAGVARTGLAFSENAYDRERFEELLHIAADMVSTVDDIRPEDQVAAWLGSVGTGVSGYVTPKIGVGAYVGNDSGQLLLIKRTDVHKWFFPTGWADIGYSPSEVCVKEVSEECGLDVEPVSIVSVFDGMRAGSPIPHYTIVFRCRLLGGELKAHPLECEDVGWFAEDAMPEPLFWGDFWVSQAFGALRSDPQPAMFDAPRNPVWRSMPG